MAQRFRLPFFLRSEAGNIAVGRVSRTFSIWRHDLLCGAVADAPPLLTRRWRNADLTSPVGSEHTYRGTISAPWCTCNSYSCSLTPPALTPNNTCSCGVWHCWRRHRCSTASAPCRWARKHATADGVNANSTFSMFVTGPLLVWNGIFLYSYTGMAGISSLVTLHSSISIIIFSLVFSCTFLCEYRGGRVSCAAGTARALLACSFAYLPHDNSRAPRAPAAHPSPPLALLRFLLPFRHA